MLNRLLTGKFGITTRYTLASVFLVANAFIGYFFAVRVLEEIINKIAANYFENLLIWSFHFAALALSTIVGALLIKRIRRRTLFVVWTVMGVTSPLSLVIFDIAQASVILLLSSLFGLSFGLGMPNCMEYYNRCTTTENRGRYGGIIMLISGLGLFSLGVTGVGGIELHALILIVWRLSGLFVLLVAKPFREEDKRGRNVSYGFVFSQRSFILYLIPWIMFSLVNYLSTPVQYNTLGESEVKSLAIIGNALLGLFAVVGGFLVDHFGRKRAAMLGFVLVGLGFSVLGLYPREPASWYFYTVVDGVAWGLLFVIFVVTVWGDLSFNSPSDKYYAIGILPFLFSKFLQLVMGNYVAEHISPYALFSFTAFFLFLAVLPLVYAPETLPEKKLKERELKQYIDKAKKVREKYVLE